MGLHRRTVSTLKSLYEHQKAAVKVEGELSDWFRVGKGVRQGCLVSPVTFNLYSEEVMRHSVDEQEWIGVTVSGRTINNLRFADDIVLIAITVDGFQQLIIMHPSVSN